MPCLCSSSSYEDEQKWLFCLTRLYPGDKFKWQEQGGRAVCEGVPKHSSLLISIQQITWPLRVDGSLCLWVKCPLPLLLGLSICQSLIAKIKLNEKVYLTRGLLLLHRCVPQYSKVCLSWLSPFLQQNI